MWLSALMAGQRSLLSAWLSIGSDISWTFLPLYAVKRVIHEGHEAHEDQSLNHRVHRVHLVFG
jgi:hypothetical protein